MSRLTKLVRVLIWIVLSVTAKSSPPSDNEIHKILVDRLGSDEASAGIVVGLIGPQGRRIISLGRRDAGNVGPVNGDTAFEIGSITKVFTALLLADMAAKNQIALSDRAAKYLPANIKLPKHNGRAITFLDLATHTSGLPFMPSESAGKYSATDLAQYVANYKFSQASADDWEYSNIGYWILSEALAARAQKDFKQLLRTRILVPLRMTNTDFELSPQVKGNLAVGHDASLHVAPGAGTLPIYSVVLPAAGGLYSTANDLLTFLSAVMDRSSSPFGPAIDLTIDTRRALKSGNEQALAWTVFKKDEIIFHDGGTLGHASAMAFDLENRIGVVVLMNKVGDVADIARHLLRPDFPLSSLINATHTEVAIDPALLASYAGKYEAKGEGIFSVVFENDFLTIEAPGDWGLPKLRIRPESSHDFFASELPLRVTFEIDEGNHVTGLLVYPPRGQKAVHAIRSSVGK